MYTADMLTSAVSQLTEEEKHAMFQIIKDNADIFDKIMPNVPLIKYVLHNTDVCPVLGQAYISWDANRPQGS